MIAVPQTDIFPIRGIDAWINMGTVIRIWIARDIQIWYVVLTTVKGLGHLRVCLVTFCSNAVMTLNVTRKKDFVLGTTRENAERLKVKKVAAYFLSNTRAACTMIAHMLMQLVTMPGVQHNLLGVTGSILEVVLT